MHAIPYPLIKFRHNLCLGRAMFSEPLFPFQNAAQIMLSNIRGTKERTSEQGHASSQQTSALNQ